VTLLLSAAAVGVLSAFLGWRARRNPLFLAGAAAFLALGRSAFIDIVPDQVLSSTTGFSVMTGDVFFAAVALGWFYARRRRPAPRVRLSARWVALGLCVLFFLGLELALTLASSGGFHPTSLLGTRDWFYIPIGYLLTLDILRRFTADETVQYVGVLSLLTTCLMVLYIASAMNIPVYPFPKSVTTSVGGTTIIRDFTTLPIWLGLAWGYYLSRPKKNGWVFAALAALAGGTMLTYTRSYILIMAAITGLAIVLLMARRGQRARALVVGAASAVLAVAVLVGGPTLAPAQYGYLSSRFGSDIASGAVLTGGTLGGRITWFRQARAAGALVDPVFGAGLFAASRSNGRSLDSYDSDWIRIVFRTGWAGVVVFAAPLILAMWWGVGAFLRRGASSTTSRLLLTAVLATAFYALSRLTTITYFWWPALSLFPVALMAYAAERPVARAAASCPVAPRDEPARFASGL